MRTFTTVVLLLATVASLGATQGRLVCLKGMDMPTNDCPLCHASAPPVAGAEFSAPPGACCTYVPGVPRATALVQPDQPSTPPVALIPAAAVAQPHGVVVPACPVPTAQCARGRPASPIPLRL